MRATVLQSKGGAWLAARDTAASAARAAGYIKLGPVSPSFLKAAEDAADLAAEKEQQAMLLRDIFGNPFRPVAVEPAWRTPAIVLLAQTAYEERRMPEGTLDNARLAVLADALEEAGCTHADILAHCRSDDRHVRGCFVIDKLLTKE